MKKSRKSLVFFFFFYKYLKFVLFRNRLILRQIQTFKTHMKKNRPTINPFEIRDVNRKTRDESYGRRTFLLDLKFEIVWDLDWKEKLSFRLNFNSKKQVRVCKKNSSSSPSQCNSEDTKKNALGVFEDKRNPLPDYK